MATPRVANRSGPGGRGTRTPPRHLADLVARRQPEAFTPFSSGARTGRNAIQPEHGGVGGKLRHPPLERAPAADLRFGAEYFFDGLLAARVRQNRERPFAGRVLPAVKFVEAWTDVFALA